MKQYDVIILGAGTAGLTARREVAKYTDNYLIIDGGPLGTTCARVGCMPSKVLIQVANDFYQQQKLVSEGLVKDGGSQVLIPATMSHVRKLRDRFVSGVIGGMSEWEDHFINGFAKFTDPYTVEVNGKSYKAKSFVVGVGSRPIVPKAWECFKDKFIDTNSFFELDTLPDRVLVVGLGVIGLELGQAISRLGVHVVGANVGRGFGGVSDPVIQDYVFEKLNGEFPVTDSGVTFIGDGSEPTISAKIFGKIQEFDKVVLAVGRRPNIDQIGVESLNVKLDKRGLPKINSQTMAVDEYPHIFIPGDVNGDRPILHEAADEGKIAGFNAVQETRCFQRRTSLGITFSDPNIAFVGRRFQELRSQGANFVTGKVSFEGQGRSIVKLKEQGLMHVYVDKVSHRILGAELQAPDGEHLAHLLAWAISLNMTVFEALKMPFYHPVIEEGLRTALRDAGRQLSPGVDELFRCDDPPIR